VETGSDVEGDRNNKQGNDKQAPSPTTAVSSYSQSGWEMVETMETAGRSARWGGRKGG
jgi:hypothetical protein